MKARSAVALAVYFSTVQFYTSLEALSITPPFGYAFLGRSGAALLACAIVVSGGACLWSLRARRFAAVRTMLGTVVLVWLAATLVSALLGFEPVAGLELIAMMLLSSGFACALVEYYPRPGVARLVVSTYLATGAVASLAGIAMVLARVPRALYASSYGRAAGLFVTSNQFAEFAEFFTFVALGFALGARSGSVRALAALASVAGFVALALTFSRECWLGAAAAAIFFTFFLGHRRSAGALAAATLAIAFVVARHPLPHHDPSDSFSRLRTLEAGVRVAELFPLTGVGPVEYFRVYPAIAPINGAAPGTFGALHPHDAYVSLAGELGLVGIVAVAYGWMRIARSLGRTLRAREPGERVVALGACAALVAGFVSGLFDTIGVVQMTFVWIPYAALAVATAEAGTAV